MRINRREFIQISGAAAAGLALSSCAGKGSIFAPARDRAKALQIRDATFEARNAKGQVVNRTTGIASVGSAALDSEECWTYQALMRAIGLVYIEHQARI
jgi:hypothetical protein